MSWIPEATVISLEIRSGPAVEDYRCGWTGCPRGRTRRDQKAFGVEIQAIYGADRYETAAGWRDPAGTTAAVLATGGFPDALSGDSAAGKNAAMLTGLIPFQFLVPGLAPSRF